MLVEERNDRLQKILAATYGVPIHVLPVVVIPPVWDHSTDAEVLTEIIEARYAGGALRDRELVRHLETGLVAFFGRGGLVAARNRLRSTLLRLQNRSPNHGTRSVFPADFPHPSRCHYRKRDAGRHL